MPDKISSLKGMLAGSLEPQTITNYKKVINKLQKTPY